MAEALAQAGIDGLGEVLSAPGPGNGPAPGHGPGQRDVLERAIAATLEPLPAQPTPPAAAAGGAAGLDRAQKAAIIVRLLLDQGSDLPLPEIGTPAMVRLVRAMAGMSHVDAATALQVVDEFLSELDGLSIRFRPGLEGAMALLGDHLDAQARAALTPAEDPSGTADPWAQLARRPAAELAALLAGETPQVTALALACLPAAAGAELLAQLPAEAARAATLAAGRAGPVAAETLERAGAALLARAEAAADRGALPGTPAERIGAVLNFAPGETRGALLDGLEAADAELAEQVRAVMFTFEDIPDRVEPREVPRIVREIDPETLPRALAGARAASPEVTDFILANLGKRLSEQLKEEVNEIGEVSRRDADAAMNAVIAAIKALEEAGEITLIAPMEEQG